MIDTIARARAALDGAFYNDRMWKALVRDLVAEIQGSDQAPPWTKDVPAHRRADLIRRCGEILALLNDVKTEVWLEGLDDAMLLVKRLLEDVLKAI